MFFDKGLRARNRELANELEDIKASPAFHLGQLMIADADRIAAAPEHVGNPALPAVVQEAYLSRRRNLVNERMARHVYGKTEAMLASAEDEIRAEADAESTAAARRNVERFVREQGPIYRADLVAKMTERKTDADIARHKLGVRHELGLVRDPEDKAALRDHARDLRERTRDTHNLPLEWLDPGDVVTLGYTSRGQGYENLTESGYGWNGESSRYRSELEVRKIELTLIDPQRGIATVEGDSWLDESNRRDNAIRAGITAFVSSYAPDTEDKAPVLIKGNPVILEGDGGEVLGATDTHDLWWANVDGYRALS